MLYNYHWHPRIEPTLWEYHPQEEGHVQARNDERTPSSKTFHASQLDQDPYKRSLDVGNRSLVLYHQLTGVLQTGQLT